MRGMILCIVLLLTTCSAGADEAEAAKDATIVETLLRLKTLDINAHPKLRAAALRHLDRQRGTLKYVELVENLNLTGVEDELLNIAIEQAAGTAGVRAGGLLLKRGESARVSRQIDGPDEEVAIQAITMLGHVGQPPALTLLKPLVTDAARSRTVRTAAATALGRNRLGERYLLEVVVNGQLPADMNFTVANILYASTDEGIRAEVGKHLQLPATANSQPLPPVAELAQRSGNATRGEQLFQTSATCAKCHKVRGSGKEVGPDLSEIGSKLSREAMFVAILDPSAGISHNYETYSVLLDSGNIVTGLKVSETDESVTIRSAESIDQVIAKSTIDELIKSSVSLMPADLQKTMSEQDLIDVVEFMSTLKKIAS